METSNIMKVGNILGIHISSIVSQAEYYVQLETPCRPSKLAKLSHRLSEPHKCWNSFLPAFPTHLILARSSLTTPWLRAKILITDPDLHYIEVQYLDSGNTERLSDAACVSDLPADLDFKPMVTLVRLDRVLMHNINHKVKLEIERMLKRGTENKEIQWKMLIKSVEVGGCLKVEIFLMKDSICSRLSDELVSAKLASLADSLPMNHSLPSIPQVTGERLAVTLCKQATPHPASIAVVLADIIKHVNEGLVTCEQGILSYLAEGGMVAVKVEDVWQRAVLVDLRPTGALVRMVDTDKEVMVEYKECKDLSDSLFSVPSALVKVSLFGLESDSWTEVNTTRLLHILHLDVEVPTTPKIYIIVHCMINKVWEVSMLEEVSRNHQVNIGALLVREKLVKSRLIPGVRVVLSWGEARGSDWSCLGVVKDTNNSAEDLDNTKDEETVESDENNNYAGTTLNHSNSVDSAVTRDYHERKEVEIVDNVTSSDREEQFVESDSNETFNSPDSGLEREESSTTMDSQANGTSPDLPDRFTAIITTIERHAGKVWLVPSFMLGKRKMVDALLLSLSRRLSEPNTGVETGEILAVGDDVLAWWEEDRCWFRARVVELHPDLSTTVIFIDWGNTEQLPVGHVLLTRPEYQGYEALRKVPDLAVPAMLYGIQMVEMQEEEMTRLSNLMAHVQSSTGRKETMAEITVCTRNPLQVQVYYNSNMLNFNLTGVLVAHRFAEMKQEHVIGCVSPPPCSLPWQFNLSWPGHVTSIHHNQVWVQPVLFSDQYGLSDKDWYMDRFVQMLDSVGRKMESKLQATYHNKTGVEVKKCFPVGQTVIWCDMENQGKCFRGVVEEKEQENRIKILLPDTGRVQFVRKHSLTRCPAELCAYPARAVKVRLDNVVAMDMITEEQVVLVTVLKGDLTVHMRIVDCLK